jgi:hypothetical protein
MPTIEQLMDIEGQIETAISTHLSGHGLTINATDETAVMVTPRAEVVATVTLDGPHETRVGGIATYDQFQVDLSVSLFVSPRGPNPQDPAAFRAKLRAVLLNYPAINLLLTDLVIAPESWRSINGVRAAMAEEDQIMLQANYVLQVFVKPASWPSSLVIPPPAEP